jgi:hypothetical protein
LAAERRLFRHPYKFPDPNPMSLNLTTQEVSIVIAAQQSPAMLREDLLKYSGIIPSSWQLSRPPVAGEQLSQLAFENGCSIASQPDRIMFLETVGDKDPEQVTIGDVARKYVETMKAAEYQAVGINFRSYVPYPGDEEAADRYISSQFLTPGDWQSFGKGNVKAALNLLYELERGQLTLSINSASVQQAEQALPILLFSGNFNYNIKNLAPEKRIPTMAVTIDNWITDYDTFRDLLVEKFLVKLGEH